MILTLTPNKSLQIYLEHRRVEFVSRCFVLPYWFAVWGPLRVPDTCRESMWQGLADERKRQPNIVSVTLSAVIVRDVKTS